MLLDRVKKLNTELDKTTNVPILHLPSLEHEQAEEVRVGTWVKTYLGDILKVKSDKIINIPILHLPSLEHEQARKEKNRTWVIIHLLHIFSESWIRRVQTSIWKHWYWLHLEPYQLRLKVDM